MAGISSHSRLKAEKRRAALAAVITGAGVLLAPRGVAPGIGGQVAQLGCGGKSGGLLRRNNTLPPLGQKNIWKIQLDLSRDASRQPVLHTLRAALLVKPQKLGHFRRAAEFVEQLDVVLVWFHRRIKHHV